MQTDFFTRKLLELFPVHANGMVTPGYTSYGLR